MVIAQNEVVLLYNPENPRDQKTLAYAMATGIKVNRQALGQTGLSITHFQWMINQLGLHPKKILNRGTPYYQNHLKGRGDDIYIWWNVLKNNPDLLLAPVAQYRQQVQICNTPMDVFKLITKAVPGGVSGAYL